jgi:hypothetical protein
MSFRKYGGLNYAATNNIVRNHYFNSDNQTISNVLGEENSKIVSASHIDLSGNYLMQTEGIYFMDGTLQTTAYIPGTGQFTNLVVSGTLTVYGEATFYSGLTVSGGLTTDTLTITSGSLTYTTLSVGDLTVTNSLTVTAPASFSSTATFSNGLTTNSITSDSSSLTPILYGTSSSVVIGSTTSSSTVYINNLTVSGTLNLNTLSLTSLTVNTITSSDIYSTNITISGTATIATLSLTNLTVSGTTSLTTTTISSLTVSGVSSFTGTATFNNVTINGTLTLSNLSLTNLTVTNTITTKKLIVIRTFVGQVNLCKTFNNKRKFPFKVKIRQFSRKTLRNIFSRKKFKIKILKDKATKNSKSYLVNEEKKFRRKMQIVIGIKE